MCCVEMTGHVSLCWPHMTCIRDDLDNSAQSCYKLPMSYVIQIT